MQFQLPFTLENLDKKIEYQDAVFLIGSCFTEHIASYLQRLKYPIVSNPYGILFNPWSIHRSIKEIFEDKRYDESDLIEQDSVYHSFQHHSLFSNTSKKAVLANINQHIVETRKFLGSCQYAIITLGTAFIYRHKSTNSFVGNNHKLSGQEFEKHLLSTQEIGQLIEDSYAYLKQLNPTIKLIVTLSPVRHIRDGLVKNNRSKARLLEAVHSVCDRDPSIFYFPAYELVIDVLRDYRFYNNDFVHPNHTAIDFVWAQFERHCLAEADQSLRNELVKLNTAMNHKAFLVNSPGHKQFKQNQAEIVGLLKTKYPFLNFDKEERYFKA